MWARYRQPWSLITGLSALPPTINKYFSDGAAYWRLANDCHHGSSVHQMYRSSCILTEFSRRLSLSIYQGFTQEKPEKYLKMSTIYSLFRGRRRRRVTYTYQRLSTAASLLGDIDYFSSQYKGVHRNCCWMEVGYLLMRVMRSLTWSNQCPLKKSSKLETTVISTLTGTQF